MDFSPLYPLLIHVAVLLAAVLVARRFRTRRVGAMPRCAHCEYALVGLSETTDRCPECGSVLSASRAVVHGDARGRWWVVIASALLILLTLVHGVRYVTTLDAEARYRLTPTSSLLDEVEQSSPANGGWRPGASADAELIRRMRERTLWRANERQIIERVVVRQADTSLPWTGEWSSLLSVVEESPETTPEELIQLASASMRFDVHVKPAIRRGAEQHMLAILRGDRDCNHREQCPLTAHWKSVSVDLGSERRVQKTVDGHGFAPGRPGANIEIFQISAGAAEPGEYPLVVTCEFVFKTDRTPEGRIRQTQQRTVRVVGERDWVDTPVRTPDAPPRIEKVIFGKALDGRPLAFVEMPPHPEALAMHVFATQDGTGRRIGQLIVDEGERSRLREIRLDATPVDQFDLDRPIDFRFEPDPVLPDEVGSFKLLRCWAEPIVLKQLRVDCSYAPTWTTDATLETAVRDAVTALIVVQNGHPSLVVRVDQPPIGIGADVVVETDGNRIVCEERVAVLRGQSMARSISVPNASLAELQRCTVRLVPYPYYESWIQQPGPVWGREIVIRNPTYVVQNADPRSEP
jgi:hypothetical protein